MTEITKSTEAKKDEMQVEKEKLESVKRPCMILQVRRCFIKN